MNIAVIGDVVSQQGCEHLRNTLSKIKKEYDCKLTVVNGENSAVGNGILPQSAKHIFDSGADIITLGNHALRRREIYEFLDENEFIIRPANFYKTAPGKGSAVFDFGKVKVGVLNLIGRSYIDNYDNPFDVADAEIEKLKNDGANIILVDFHAESTAEKKAMGFYLDGRVSAVYGTHTHIQTADEQILPNGTGYITDLGMTGPFYSVLGVTPELAIERMRTSMPVRFLNPDGPCVCEGCIFEIDEKSYKTISVKRIRY